MEPKTAWIMKDGNFSYARVVITGEDFDYWYTSSRESFSKKEYKVFSTEENAQKESNKRQTGGS